MAEHKAIMENMMQSDIGTTDDTYAILLSEEVRKRISGLFLKADVQAWLSTGLECIPNEKLSEMLIEVAKGLAK
jgi:hypothetical protein